MVQRSFNEALDLDVFRGMVLNSIRKNISKHRPAFGSKVILACDSRYTWRKKYYPYYKSGRKSGRDESPIDWTKIYENLSIIKSELKEYFPYHVIELEGCEGDDIIGVLAMSCTEKCLIISGDKDFAQLLKYMHISQWNPIKDKFVECNDPDQFLIDHIIHGDKSDGIPNILAADDQMVTGTRAPVLSKKRVEELKAEISSGNINTLGYFRNKKLIDLSEIPEDIKEKIITEYESQPTKNKQRVMTYFIKHGLTRYVESIGDF